MLHGRNDERPFDSRRGDKFCVWMAICLAAFLADRHFMLRNYSEMSNFLIMVPFSKNYSSHPRDNAANIEVRLVYERVVYLQCILLSLNLLA